MAYNPISMNQVKQIFQLHRQGVGIKRIAATLGMSKNTVKAYLRNTDLSQLTEDQLLSMANPVLKDHLTPVASQEKMNYQEFLQRAEYYVQELTHRKRTHVTRMVLWEEDFSAGLIHMKYSRFCFHLQRYLKSKHPSMVMRHMPGDKMFIDFAGEKLYYIDRVSGNRIAVEVLLLTLGYSNYTLAIGVPSQKNEHLIEGLVLLFTRLGGVTSALVPDNLKSAVTTPDRYDPKINEAFLDLANYYGLVVLPTRPVKPQDKAKVETHVNVVYKQVYAKLRNCTFYSLEEINEGLLEKIDLLNDNVMQDYGVSRRVMLERDERTHLKPLPSTPYALVRQAKVTVLQNGHIKVKAINKYLSVPYQLIGEKVTVLISNGIARVYHRRECVATHIVTKGGLYLTQRDHMASSHQAHLDNLSPDTLKEKAMAIGPEVHALIILVLAKGQYPEQAYRTCQGILALQFKCERSRFRKSCEIAVANGMISLRYLRHLVESPHVTLTALPESQTTLPLHENIRGAENYQ